MQRFVHHLVISDGEDNNACTILARETGLSRSTVKDAMCKGAVWLQSKNKRQRLRRATRIPARGDQLSFYYDRDLLSIDPLPSRLHADHGVYSVWDKPAGVLSQGTDYGDHCSLPRFVEGYFQPRRLTFLVHRLDREASGLMLVAHSQKAANKLCEAFRDKTIEKYYKIRVLGDLRNYPQGLQGSINIPVNGLSARTDFEILFYDPVTTTTVVKAQISTGRTHQLRQHFAAIGYPIMGDPRYGRGNKNKTGLCLAATGLHFHCPISGALRDHVVDHNI